MKKALLVVVVLIPLLASCDTSADTTVKTVRLPDGTICAVAKTARTASIDCDWNDTKK